MIENDQIRALSLRVGLIKNLVNNVAIDAGTVVSFLQLDGIVDIMEQMDAFFKLVINTYTENNVKKLAENVDFRGIFKGISPESDDKVIDFFSGFLKLYVEDDIMDPIEDRLDNLLALDYDDVPDTCEIKRLFIYMALLLALSKSPMDLALIEELNEKLQRTL